MTRRFTVFHPRHGDWNRGDIVTLQITARRAGVHAAIGWTYAVGKISPAKEKLLVLGKEALDAAVAVTVKSARVGDVGAAIQSKVEGAGYNVIRDFTGYGMGRVMLTEPQIPCNGTKGRGRRFKEGQVLNLHVILSEGDWRLNILDDEWTAVMADGSQSAVFTAMVEVQQDRALRLTHAPE